MTGTTTLELTQKQLRVLNLALQKLIKYQDKADDVYAGDQGDIRLMQSVAALVLSHCIERRMEA